MNNKTPKHAIRSLIRTADILITRQEIQISRASFCPLLYLSYFPQVTRGAAAGLCMVKRYKQAFLNKSCLWIIHSGCAGASLPTGTHPIEPAYQCIQKLLEGQKYPINMWNGNSEGILEWCILMFHLSHKWVFFVLFLYDSVAQWINSSSSEVHCFLNGILLPGDF